MHRTIGWLVVVVAIVITLSDQPRGQAAPVNAETSITSTQALHALEDASSELEQLAHVQHEMMRISEQQANIYAALSKQAAALSSLAGSKASQAQLEQATKSMQEAQMSFNLQYLGLQNQMQNENRQFTMVSNIMKTKHDTAKNSISNMR